MTDFTIPQTSERPFKAGDVIEFGDITELAVFEDIIAPIVDPGYDPELWSCRPNVRDLIRPPKFNGRIGDIALTVMESPYENLLTASSRGLKIGSGCGSFRRTSDRANKEIKHYMGFGLTANASSTGRGVIGQIATELYYYPCPRQVHEDYNYSSGSLTGEAIRRVVAKPKLETSKFIELEKTARWIGLETLRKAMMHPIITPHRQ